jgi:hypothetical protein
MDNKTMPGLAGETVRLAAVNPEVDSEPMAAWSRDPELLRNFNTSAARHWTPRSMREITA